MLLHILSGAFQFGGLNEDSITSRNPSPTYLVAYYDKCSMFESVNDISWCYVYVHKYNVKKVATT